MAVERSVGKLASCTRLTTVTKKKKNKREKRKGKPRTIIQFAAALRIASHRHITYTPRVTNRKRKPRRSDDALCMPDLQSIRIL